MLLGGNQMHKTPLSTRILSVLFSVSLLTSVFTVLSPHQANAASASTSATYYRSNTIFTTVRHHTPGYMSWENQRGTTHWSDGTTTSTYCGGASGDAVALRYPGGNQFAVTYFIPTKANHKSFPQSYGARDFVMSFAIKGTCGAPPWEESRSVWGVIHY